MKKSLIITIGLAVAGAIVVMIFGIYMPRQAEDYNFRTYCGSCHALPDPSHLPRHIWERNILPDMGARLGIKVDDYDPMAILSPLEVLEFKRAGIYPSKPLMEIDDWEQLREYVLSKAPEKILYDTVHAIPEGNRFTPSKINVDNRKNSFITSIRFMKELNALYITNVEGDLIQWTADSAINIYDFQMPMTSSYKFGDAVYAIEVGQMHPTDLSLGKIWRMTTSGYPEEVDLGLRRPVHLNVSDLNSDGLEDLIVSEYGNQLGQFSIYHQNEEGFSKKILANFPGSIKSYIHDMDADGLDDIVVLAAQGNEGVFIFYQRSDLNFTTDQVIRNNSVYGSSDFDLFDYEGDGDMDIVIACGDNADISAIPKSYHGVRLYINDGSNRFTETQFLPMYGATQVEAGDYDNDGDVDLAATAFFAEYELSPDGAFIYFENTESESYSFTASTFSDNQAGRWITLEKGDIDQDGDLDLFLGSFVYSPDNPSLQLQNRWADNKMDMMFLENQTIMAEPLQLD